MVGTSSDDTIKGRAGDDTITGLGGKDILLGSSGIDIIDGGAKYGQVRPGTVDLRVDLFPERGPVVKGASLRINCNVGLAGIKNNDPDTGETLAEGFWLTLPATATFGPTGAVGPFVPRDPILGITEITG